jgi:hypothetical protein
MFRYSRFRRLMPLGALALAMALGGCYAYPAYPGYYGGYPGYSAYPAPYYGGGVVAFGGGWGWHGGGWGGGWHDGGWHH